MKLGDRRGIRGNIRRTVKELTAEFCRNKAEEFKKIAEDTDDEDARLFALEYRLLGYQLEDRWRRDMINAGKRRVKA